jgi:putative phosphoserine phosphatase/1-acylglycerol-3-phosphate O-acyltransferase
MVEPRVAAFFDVDHTLLDVNSGLHWARHQRRAGLISTMNFLRAAFWMVRYRLTTIDQESLIGRVAGAYAGTSVAHAEAEMGRWFDAEMTRFIRPAGLVRVREHLAAGHIVAIMSSGTRFTLEPLARLLGISHVVCTVFEERDGLLTGLHVRPACAGAGKVTMAERFASEHDVDLGASYFYTDSHADIGLLERVGLPRVITPDRRLRRQARLRGWRIEDWAIA